MMIICPVPVNLCVHISRSTHSVCVIHKSSVCVCVCVLLVWCGNSSDFLYGVTLPLPCSPCPAISTFTIWLELSLFATSVLALPLSLVFQWTDHPWKILSRWSKYKKGERTKWDTPYPPPFFHLPISFLLLYVALISTVMYLYLLNSATYTFNPRPLN